MSVPCCLVSIQWLLGLTIASHAILPEVPRPYYTVGRSTIQVKSKTFLSPSRCFRLAITEKLPKICLILSTWNHGGWYSGNMHGFGKEVREAHQKSDCACLRTMYALVTLTLTFIISVCDMLVPFHTKEYFAEHSSSHAFSYLLSREKSTPYDKEQTINNKQPDNALDPSQDEYQ